MAQTTPRPAFEGPRVEAVVGTDGGLIYGGAIGYDLQRGKLALGLEGEIDLSNRQSCDTLEPSFNSRLCERNRRDLYVGGRIGVAVAPSTLLYAKVGYTHIRQRVTYDPGSSGDSGFTFVDARDGIRVGAGIEQKLGSKVYVKGEYRYSNYRFGGFKHDGVVGVGIRF